MKNKNVKVIDEHNIDRSANVMFALELEGSEYVVYWVERDAESNNVFVSKVLRNIDNTYNMLNIDDVDKKEEIANIVKTLISTAVSDQSDKLTGAETTLANGKVVKFVNVSFNKEQYINVQKTYITTVKKEVTVVAEKYYDVVAEVPQVAAAPVVTPVVEPVVETPTVEVAPQPVVQPTPVVAPVQEVVMPSIPATPVPSVQEVTPAVVESITVAQPVVTPEPVAPVTEVPNVEPAVVIPTPVISEPVAVAPVVEPQKAEPTVIEPIPVVPEPLQEVGVQPLVFNASKENNLNAALGEVASSTTIPVENVSPVREFGVDEPVKQVVPEVAPAVATVTQPVTDTSSTANSVPVSPKSGGFANSKFFMVVAVAFFLASCIFLGYEVFNYFQLIK